MSNFVTHKTKFPGCQLFFAKLSQV
jgi:hypothetical protein